MEMLDNLPGGSRADKLEKLIRDAHNALRRISSIEEEPASAVIAYVLSQVPGWGKERVWELIFKILEWVRDSRLPNNEIAELVQENYQKLLDSESIKPERLVALASGAMPNVSDLTKLAHSLELEEEVLVKMRDRLIGQQPFPHESAEKAKEEETNGTL